MGEVPGHDPLGPRFRQCGNRAEGRDIVDWRKSSYSSNGGQTCVEVGQESGILIRDTTDRAGFTLEVPASAWAKFLAAIR